MKRGLDFRHRDSQAGVRTRKLGFSQIELTMSALIAGIVLSAALNLAGSATRSQISNSDQLQARLIASGLMAEILELPFEEPSGTVAFGRESGETTSPATRNLFDDVDDFHNWNSTAQTKSGQAIENSWGLTTSVQVALADPDQLGVSGGGSPSSDVKRITVSVSRGSSVVCQLTGVVTK